jgi:hypothetical protein
MMVSEAELDEREIFGRRRFLMPRGPEISQRLGLFTVPVGALERGSIGHPPTHVGSGVLVRLKDRFFVFTAGHCCDDIESTILIAIARHRDRPHRFEANVKNVRRVYTADGADYGYVEVGENDAATIQSQARVFASERLLQVVAQTQLITDFEWLTFAGYPRAFHTDYPQRNASGIRFMYIHGAPSGKTGTPQNPLSPPSPELHFVDLAVPQETTLAAEDGSRRIVGLPSLAGVSGGGCWKPNRAAETWSPDQYRLVGVVSSGHSAEIGSEFASFFRVVLIAHHLKLVADDYPDLRDHIYSKFELLTFL